MNNVYPLNYESIPEEDYHPSRYTIQRHEAERAGTHKDIRILMGDKAYSFASRYELPKEPGEVRKVIEQPVHAREYATWEGELPEGYGKGKVALEDNQAVTIKTTPDKIYMDIHGGPNTGRYTMVRKEGKEWLVIRRKPLEAYWSPRESFSTRIPEHAWKDKNYIAMIKRNGANFISKVSPQGSSFVSRRLSRDGTMIQRDNVVPHLRDIKLPNKFNDMVLKGELWHPMGFNFLSGLLLSSPEKSLEAQKKYGFIHYMPFDVEKGYKGEDVSSLPFKERWKLIQDYVKAADTPFIQYPEHAFSGKKKFFKELTDQGEEGIVLRNMDSGSEKPYKIKKEIDYDLRVVDYTPGQGKAAGGIGTLVVEDREGKKVADVGTGYTDAQRRWLLENFDQVKGQLIKVRGRKPSAYRILAPVFQGFTTDKSEPDLVVAPRDQALYSRLRGMGVSEDELQRTKYKLLSGVLKNRR